MQEDKTNEVPDRRLNRDEQVRSRLDRGVRVERTGRMGRRVASGADNSSNPRAFGPGGFRPGGDGLEKRPDKPKKKGSSGFFKRFADVRIFAFVICLIVIGVIIAFSRHKKQTVNIESDTMAATEVQKLINKDLELAYPATPSEVVKLYSRISQCIYNDNITDEELGQVLDQLRKLYSSELLSANPRDTHLQNISAERKRFKEDKKRLVNYNVDKNSSVIYKEINGQECAYLQMYYFMNWGRNYGKSYHEFILINEGGKWKIHVFRRKVEEKEQKTEEEEDTND
ncbi:DUF6715 family protein [Eubacterium xylanophilum]|uniref:DUF6715 family protein n=1 Tax=Eubacterium xylanophilum TaxID=39497 RepID=UPI00047C31E2|nr:DUF6715 family protein [Eubacterium xylanophilum]